MERTMILPEDEHMILAYAYLWSVEIGKPVEESCGYLVYETMPDVRDDLLRDLDGFVL